MQVHLLFPTSVAEGRYLEQVAVFLARRTRTLKAHDDLWREVRGYSDERLTSFLERVVYNDYATDVLEFPFLIYDLEAVPYWLVMELLRHRFLAREFSIEQLSQRAISPFRLAVDVPQQCADSVSTYLAKLAEVSTDLPPEEVRKALPQGVLVNLGIGGNARAFHHLFVMRCSKSMGGHGTAHPCFQRLADDMLRLARAVYPHIFNRLING